MGWKGKFIGGFLGGIPGTIIGDLVQETMKNSGSSSNEPSDRGQASVSEQHPVGKVPCQECGVMILPSTSERTGGKCMPCQSGKRRK